MRRQRELALKIRSSGAARAPHVATTFVFVRCVSVRPQPSSSQSFSSPLLGSLIYAVFGRLPIRCAFCTRDRGQGASQIVHVSSRVRATPKPVAP